jgi:hypothetical protein
MSEIVPFLWVAGVLFVLFLFFTTSGRTILAAMFGATFTAIFGHLMLFVKFLWRAHATVAKNLFLPRSIIYPTLDSGDNVSKK